jgi:hypothetical protein
MNLTNTNSKVKIQGKLSPNLKQWLDFDKEIRYPPFYSAYGKDNEKY